MIVVGGTNMHGNILHVIVGPETDTWTGMHGAAMANITPLLNNFDTSKPVFIHFTYCGSETDMSQHIMSSGMAGQQYPFPVPTMVFGTTPPSEKQSDEGEGEEKPTEKTHKHTAVKKIACSQCGNPKNELVPKTEPPICYECLAIDRMLASTRKPEQPPARPSRKKGTDPDAPSTSKPAAPKPPE
jgi:hypothetical protein